MVDEVVVRSGKTVKVGGEAWVITRDDAPVESVDMLCEARYFNGTVFLSFIQTVIDAGATPEAYINCRLRMNLATAQGLHGVLSQLISDALKPADQSKAN